ncbi:MAG: alpha/beta fold hydrolase [Cellvibrio sp.]
MIRCFLRILGFTAILLSLTTFNLAAAKPVLQDYGILPEIQLITISPSGNLVAFRKVTNDSDRIFVTSLAERKAVTAIDVSAMQPNSIFFLGENQLILVASKNTKLMGYRDKIDLSTAYLFDIKANSVRQLLIPGEVIYRGQSGLGKVLGISPDGNYAYMPAYVGEDSVEAPEYSLLKVNLKDKRVPTVYSKGSHATNDFFLDTQGNVIAQESYSNSSNVHKVRAKQNDEWVDIFKDNVAIPEKSFVGLTPDFKSLVFIDAEENSERNAYYTMALSDGKISGPIFGRDDADIEMVITNYQRIVLGVRYSGLRPSYKFFDPAFDKRIADIIANFPEQSVYISDYSPDLKNIVVSVEGPNAAGDYYLFSEGKPAQFLAAERTNIKAEDIHPIGTVTFKARDELKIPTILTIPKSKLADMKNLPAVIMPHGGPASHDSIRFDWFAQALADNGYLVIQPQFRGSDGFGLKHEMAGWGEWGKKMQDDLTDTINFVVKKGIVDPNRVCIVGASYGGYAALAGGAFTPDLYKCVVSIAGIGDLKSMLDWDKSQRGKDSWIVTYMERQFLNGDNDKAAMAAVSPEEFADKFKAPVLLIHGVDDKRVSFKQSQQMNSALKKAKKNVTFVELKGEDHYLSNGPTRLKALEETMKFVNAHIGQNHP